MNNLKNYNLEKLKWVFRGLAIFMIASIVINFFLDCVFLTLLSYCALILGYMLTVLGLNTISIYSNIFKVAFYCAVALMVIVIGYIMGSSIGKTINDAVISPILDYTDVVVVIAIIGLVISFYFLMLRGLKEFSMNLEEEKFSRKIEIFLHLFILIVIVIAFTTIIAFFIPQIKDFLIELTKIAYVFVNTFLCVYLYQAYKLFNGREILSKPVFFGDIESQEIKSEVIN